LAEYLVLLRNFLESFDTILVGGRTQQETAEKKGESVAEEKQSFWQMLLSGRVSTERERKVLEYICHRVGNGAHLRDVMQEEYVRRHASSDEVQDILDNPRLVETAHEKMREDFSSGYLDPKPSRSFTQ
jgi:alpha-glucuronidase